MSEINLARGLPSWEEEHGKEETVIDKNSTADEAWSAYQDEKQVKAEQNPSIPRTEIVKTSEAVVADCNADLGITCTAGNNGEPCHECAAGRAYWQSWGRGMRFNRYSDDDIRDAYSSPAESHKRNALLGER